MTKYRIDISPGVLADIHIDRLFENNEIEPRKLGRPPLEKLDGSAFDLPLGKNAWQLQQGQRPTTREFQKLLDRSTPVQLEEDELGSYFHFKAGSIYLVELDYNLHLPANINGRATGKSSVGRLDVITRLLTNNCREYDVVESGYDGPLHLLVLPQTFSIKVAPGKSLNQLRLFSGPPHASIITRYMIRDFGTEFWHIPTPNPSASHPYERWDDVINKYIESQTADPNLFDLTVELADPDFQYIFQAFGDEYTTASVTGKPQDSAPQDGGPKTAEIVLAVEKLSAKHEPIDLRKSVESHNPKDYFTKVDVERSTRPPSVVLTQNNFYIMKSKERLYIPPDVAVEVVAISERIGDIRIHYAGFAHPGFGRHEDRTKPGTPLIFEVRATDMATRLYDGSLLARIQLFRMSAATKLPKSPYDKQELKLSSVFRSWDTE